VAEKCTVHLARSSDFLAKGSVKLATGFLLYYTPLLVVSPSSTYYLHLISDYKGYDFCESFLSPSGPPRRIYELSVTRRFSNPFHLLFRSFPLAAIRTVLLPPKYFSLLAGPKTFLSLCWRIALS